MTSRRRIVFRVSCWVDMPIGLGLLMFSISIRGQMPGVRP